MQHSITIDGVQYERVNTNGESLCIVIADNRGLTFIGRVNTSSLAEDAGVVTIRGARCIVRWGTTEHLAQIAAGPTENTRLGAKRDVIVRLASVVAFYVADEEGWASHV